MITISQGELQALERCLTDGRTTSGILFASSAMFFYDYLLTFHQEAEYIWRTKISLGTTMFCFARYPAFVTALLVLLPKADDDVSMTNVTSCLRFISILSAELILALRAWAIWERSRVILVTLVCVTIAGMVPAVIITIRDISSTTMDPNAPPGFPQCGFLVSTVKQLWVVPYLIIILYELVTLTLTLTKIAQLHGRIPTQLRSSLLTTLRIDGIIYFISMLVLGAFNIALIVQVQSPQLRQGGTQLQTVIHSMVSTRIVFHVMMTTSNDISRAGSSLQPMTFLTMGVEMDDLTRNAHQDGGEEGDRRDRIDEQ